MKEKVEIEEQELKIGETVRRLRELKGWSREKLAEEAGISSATIYKLEQNMMTPTITTLIKIARALRKDIKEFLKDSIDKKGWTITKRDNRLTLNTHELGFKIEKVSGEFEEKKLEGIILKIKKGASSGEDLLTHRGEEIHFVIKGKMEYVMENHKAVLEEGDTIHFKGSIPHLWKNIGNEEALVLIVVTPPPFT